MLLLISKALKRMSILATHLPPQIKMKYPDYNDVGNWLFLFHYFSIDFLQAINIDSTL